MADAQKYKEGNIEASFPLRSWNNIFWQALEKYAILVKGTFYWI